MAVRGSGGPSQFHLIRHPRTVAAPGVCYGSTDLALAEHPVDCARRIGTLLPPTPVVITSPASRCLQLSRMLHDKPRIEPRLSEIHFGAWEMQAYDRLPRKAIDAWAADPLAFRPPQGETANEMLSRVRAATEEILAQKPDGVAVVAHGGSLVTFKRSISSGGAFVSFSETRCALPLKTLPH